MEKRAVIDENTPDLKPAEKKAGDKEESKPAEDKHIASAAAEKARKTLKGE